MESESITAANMVFPAEDGWTRFLKRGCFEGGGYRYSISTALRRRRIRREPFLSRRDPPISLNGTLTSLERKAGIARSLVGCAVDGRARLVTATGRMAGSKSACHSDHDDLSQENSSRKTRCPEAPPPCFVSSWLASPPIIRLVGCMTAARCSSGRAPLHFPARCSPYPRLAPRRRSLAPPTDTPLFARSCQDDPSPRLAPGVMAGCGPCENERYSHSLPRCLSSHSAFSSLTKALRRRTLSSILLHRSR
jgi:hypothetical protein